MILALETATEVCSAALVAEGKVAAVRSVQEKNIHSERLLTLVQEVMTEAGTARHQLTAVAVSIGPGSFTGLRIGLSTAKGLVMALNLPLIAVPTLDGIAESFRLQQNAPVPVPFCGMIDAKREEAYYALYTVSRNDIERTSEFAITFKKDILVRAASADAVTGQPLLTAAAVGLLAERRRMEWTVTDPATAEPLYLRDFVTTLPGKKK